MLEIPKDDAISLYPSKGKVGGIHCSSLWPWFLGNTGTCIDGVYKIKSQ